MVSENSTAAPVWLTVKEAAARARCGAKLIYRAADSGALKSAKAGGRLYRFRNEWVDDWIESSITPREDRS